MTNCLGIYFDDNIVKYAKLVKNSAGGVEIKEHGIKFVRTSVKETLDKVVAETNSITDVPIVINAPKTEYNVFQVFKQISANDIQNIIKLEFEDWCEKKGLGTANFSYVYTLSSTVIGDYHKGIMAVSSKQLIEDNSKIGESKVVGMYPSELLSYTNVPTDEKNYILIDLDKKLNITTVLNSKTVSTTICETGMQVIFDKFIDILGSYQKAYDACKQLNVFSDGTSETNQVELEEIVEPILQEVLHLVAEEVNKYRDSLTKLYITGTSILFTNIDTLFTEYFNIRCEILKPNFITDVGGVRNIAEALEVLPAIALAKEYLYPATTGLEFIKKNEVKKDFFKELFAKKKPDDAKSKAKIEEKQTKEIKKINGEIPSTFNLNKVIEYAMYPIIVFFLIASSYLVFSNIYMNQVIAMKDEINVKIKSYEKMSDQASNDKKTIEVATAEYVTVNDEVEELKKQIELNQIGKFKTYNVAAFTQKLIKVIPSNVQLKTISSDDNKKVTIVAQAANYPNLGYFVANLRLQPDILSNITINSITNGTTVTIEIGGDLP